MSGKGRPESDATRAARLHELSVLLAAGVDWDRAWSLVGGRGRSLRPMFALRQQGWIRPVEQPLLEAFETIGRLDKGLSLLAGQLESGLRVREKMRSALYLPAGLLTIALLVMPLPALFAGQLSTTGYLGAVLSPAMVLALLLWLGFRYLPTVLAHFDNLRLHFGRPLSLVQRTALYHLLAELLDAGLPVRDSLRLLARVFTRPLRQRLDAVVEEIPGRPWLLALHDHGLLSDPAEYRLAVAGEAAGRLPETLARLCARHSEQLALRREIMVEWTPRAVYALGLFWVLQGWLG